MLLIYGFHTHQGSVQNVELLEMRNEIIQHETEAPELRTALVLDLPRRGPGVVGLPTGCWF